MRSLNKIMLYIAVVIGIILAVYFLVNYIPASKIVLESHRKDLPRLNPMSYVFDFPLGTIRDTILKRFNYHDGVDKEYCNDFRWMRLCTSRTDDTPELRRPGMTRDLIFKSGGVRSYVYWKDEGHYYYDFQMRVHFDSLAPSCTKLTITTRKAKIESGNYICFGDSGFFMASVYQRVRPSTVEEYQLLYNIGRVLGVTMSPVVFPEDLTEEQIWSTFFSVSGWHDIKSPFVPGHK